MVRYAATIFLSAFLLFQVQPLVGKRILPWFGGGTAVWTTCMLFFQVLLLAGYAYAHAVRTWLPHRREVVVHLVVLAAALLFLPLAPGESWKPVGGEDPTWRILGLLAATVGLPYLVLASTSPLLQAWFSVTAPGRSPYRLYALSNAGSLLALLSFPFVVEPALSLRTQALAWSVGFVVFAALGVYCALRTWRVGARVEARSGDEAGGTQERPPSLAVRLLWLALAACGSMMLLAVTNQMCWDIAVVPFLWVLPLSLYLLSFIICFHNEEWYVRPAFWVLLLVSMAGMTWLLFGDVDVPILVQVFGFSAGLFVCCMVCHGELVRLKPGSRYLTSFYLMCSAGGALGGVLVTLVAPRVFRGYFELHVGMWACCLLAMAAWWHDRKPHLHWRRAWWARLCLPAFVTVLAVLGSVLWFQASQASKWAEWTSRNFYGVLRVTSDGEPGDEFACRTLEHGRISHGSQFLSAKRRRQPTTYYGHGSGVGLALLNLARGSGLRVGVVGLGAGTLAAYGTPGDRFRFYEINPEVQRLATTMFTYLADSEAACEVVLGDARLSLEREPPQDFDLLALDAFTSGAIPVHLLTKEAFAVYLRHLKPGGVLAVHVSNHYLDLIPVARAAAAHFGLKSVVIDSDGDRVEQLDDATWVLITGDDRLLACAAIQAAKTDEADLSPRLCLWTDDYSNLFELIE